MHQKWEEFKKSMQPTIRELKFMIYRVSKSPLSVAGFAIIVFFVIVAICAPVLAPPQGSDPFMIPYDDLLRSRPISGSLSPIPPCKGHPFGTVFEQYDIYYGCIWGTINAFRVGLLVVGAALIFGVAIGTIAGYYGGLVDEVMMRFTDIIFAFPGLILAMALVVVIRDKQPIDASLLATIVTGVLFIIVATRRVKVHFKVAMGAIFLVFLALTFCNPLVITIQFTRLDKVLLALMLIGWPGYARLIRGEVIKIRNEDFVEAAKAVGCSDLRIIVRHVLPNTIYSLLVVATLDTGSIVLTAAALSFLGIGAPSGYADWGWMISLSREWIGTGEMLVNYFHAFMIPGIFIFVFVLGWNLLGDAFRDILDPMLRRR